MELNGKGAVDLANMLRIVEDINILKDITEACEDGTTRVGFTATYRRGAEFFKDRMRDAGLIVREDSIGNVYGRLEGRYNDKPVILSGSHLDTVRCAGAYDGIAGAVCALEVARRLKENQVILNHSFEVMGLIEEEGTRFGQVLLGSKFVTGAFTDESMDQIKDPDDGRTLREIVKEYAVPDACPAYRNKEEVKAFLELHDEQGPLLETEGVDVGIVENIVAISWLTVTVIGFAGHAGTVPMPLRQDAATGASKLISSISDYTTENYAYTATATVGKLQLTPGSSNCVPSKCVFTVDLRSGEMSNVEEVINYIRECAANIASECDVNIEISVDSKQEAIAMDKDLRRCMHASCEKLGYSHRDINSGAGHDAMIFSSHWPTAMIFIPCVKGITHNPKEYVHPEFLAKGADVLYETILTIDKS